MDYEGEKNSANFKVILIRVAGIMRGVESDDCREQRREAIIRGDLVLVLISARTRRLATMIPLPGPFFSPTRT